MKTQIDKHTFIKTFDDYGRSDDFSYEAREALFEYYEELEKSCDTEIEFDCIAICCDWSEHEDAHNWAIDYFSHDQRLEHLNEIAKSDGSIEDYFGEYLRDNTQVIEFDGGILVMAF